MNRLANTSLQTRRLILIPPQVSDFSESAVMWADPIVTRYTTRSILSKEEAWFRLLRNIGHWYAMEYGIWVIRDKITHAFIGEGGISDYQCDITIEDDCCLPEISLALMPHAHRRGFSVEIIDAILQWSDRYVPSDKISSLIYPDNSSAIRLAQHFGFSGENRFIYKNEPILRFTRLSQKPS
ncbi:MAG: GNAT family N-acetyltransferase [Gammaproteobacteria bacterium]|nr:GNAT family N-acetyltransferase [Gammaproteobacteria bacterium]